jgi:hypothetical protein
MERLPSFEVGGVMHERTPLTRAVIERQPKLRVIASTARSSDGTRKTSHRRSVAVDVVPYIGDHD